MAHHFTGNIYLNEKVWNSISILLKCVPKGPINNKPALDQIMVWHWIVMRYYLNQCWPVWSRNICAPSLNVLNKLNDLEVTSIFHWPLPDKPWYPWSIITLKTWLKYLPMSEMADISQTIFLKAFLVRICHQASGVKLVNILALAQGCDVVATILITHREIILWICDLSSAVFKTEIYTLSPRKFCTLIGLLWFYLPSGNLTDQAKSLVAMGDRVTISLNTAYINKNPLQRDYLKIVLSHNGNSYTDTWSFYWLILGIGPSRQEWSILAL